MKLFEQTKDMLMPVLENNKRVGIMLSGGLDSGTLAWCLCKIVQDHDLDNVITFYTSPRPDNSITHADNMSKAIQSNLGIKLKHKMRGDGNAHHSQQVWTGMQVAMMENDVVLTAETAQPEHMQTDHFERLRVDSEKAFQPFFDITKEFTVALAIEQGLDFVMELSHSCTETADVRCGVCWWCRERAWAFEANNHTDPGVL